MYLQRIFFLTLMLISSRTFSQNLYFPPLDDSQWETISPAELGWCEDEIQALLSFLEASNTKAFLVLKDGKIVMEHYFGDFQQTDPWYWASAGKSLTAFLIGVAQQQGLLDIDLPSHTYLGPGWSSLTSEQEEAITVRHHLTMTTGLNDIDVNLDCTLPECLTYLAEPGTRWAYHNAPYTILDQVIETATGQTLNAFLFSTLTPITGINAAFLPVEDNNVCFSNPRDFARFGLLALNQGTWNNTPILNDLEYFNSMTTSSQSLNESYGYLWWLNDASSYMLPGVQFVFPGVPMPDAPQHMFSAMGKNGQILNIDPDNNIIVLRMGDAPTNDVVFVPTLYNNDIWELLQPVMCSETVVTEHEIDFNIYPNPANSFLQLSDWSGNVEFRICDLSGREVEKGSTANQQINISDLANGVYLLTCKNAKKSGITRFIVEH